MDKPKLRILNMAGNRFAELVQGDAILLSVRDEMPHLKRSAAVVIRHRFSEMRADIVERTKRVERYEALVLSAAHQDQKGD